ncbi:DUF2516 family protein [Solicola gregarius]|uniref:DUF2516 family protein n=1 Tax=Solicola gregarius TaxID=2908642 RepID=A0AA46TKA4_9ACTN|nr:DUF2516 family protein [Solicola gregarius]UYM06877.1 DUF2516 family protein [Solicola gregarius]
MVEIFQFQSAVETAITFVLLAIKGFAFIDAATRPAAQFLAADKQTKQLWLILLGLAFVANLLIIQPISLLNLAGTVAALVYVADVWPTLRRLPRR